MKIFMDNFRITENYLVNNKVVVVSYNNADIGFYSFVINNEADLELDYFFIHPNYIGKGLGRKMWDSCIETAGTYDMPYFVLWSDPNADRFYKAMNCVKIGERKSPVLPDRYPALFKYSL